MKTLSISFSNSIFSSLRHHHHGFHPAVSSGKSKSLVVNARRGTGDGGNLVDENMIVLRLRIKEVEIEEQGGLQPTMSENWMEWEKKYYEDYNRDIFEVMGVLQMFLMNTRPSLALGTVALLMLSLPLSASVISYNFIRLVQSLL